jgi:RNA recognition motif-containing protein
LVLRCVSQKKFAQKEKKTEEKDTDCGRRCIRWIIMTQATRALFVGNIDPGVRPKELTILFEEKGKVEKLGTQIKNKVVILLIQLADLKAGFAFIFMPNQEEAEAALDAYNNYEWSENNRRPLKVEWAKGDGVVKQYGRYIFAFFFLQANFPVQSRR